MSVMENSELALNHYWDFYGLKSDPFVNSLPSQEFYISPHWEKCFDLLNYLCQTANSIITLTGERKVGKTVFIEQYLTQQQERAQICFFTNSRDLKKEIFLKGIREKFDLLEIDTEYFEERLDFYLSSIQHKSHLCLLVIDDAQELSDEILTILLYFVLHQSETQMRLHIILVGSAEIMTKLEALQNDTRENSIVSNVELAPYDMSETQNYLYYRLKNVGLPAASPFTEEDAKKINLKSAGSMTDINALARQSLQKKMQTYPFKNFLEVMNEYKTQFMGSFIFLLALIMSAMLLSKHSHQFITRPAMIVHKAEIATPKDEPTPEIIHKNSMPDFNLTAAALAPPQTNAAPAAVTQKQINTKALQPSVKPLKHSTDLSAKENKPVKLIKTPAPIPVNTKMNGYTLQLIGVSSEQSMKNFITNNKLTNASAYYQSSLGGKNWFVVLYGSYATPEAAHAAIATLPATVKMQKPFIRKLTTVQYPIHKLG